MTQASQSLQTSPTRSPTSPTNYRVRYQATSSDDPLELRAQVERLIGVLNQPLEPRLAGANVFGVNVALTRQRNAIVHSQPYWNPGIASVVFRTHLEEPSLVGQFASGLTYNVSLEAIPDPSAGLYWTWSDPHTTYDLLDTDSYAPVDWLEPVFAGLTTWAFMTPAAEIAHASNWLEEVAPMQGAITSELVAPASDNDNGNQLVDPIYEAALLAIREGIAERGAPRHFVGSAEDLLLDNDLDEPVPEVANHFAEEPYQPEIGRGPFRAKKL